ncbi:MAG: tRNA lysidine(34) synthetase TilS [Planctomycetota bacterium]|nr:tRNA lysidine(34) synthetase TilS [Planctomycetota bacterium]
MLTEFEKKILKFIYSEELFGSGDRILLAISGGADSTALMYAMQQLKADGPLKTEFLCAHINHQLRGLDADADENFVIEQAAILEMPVKTRKINVADYACENKLSIETAARKLRIEALLDIAKANGCNVIAAAHHKDDNAETIIQRLSRGTGFRGLCGIWPKRTFDGINFVRPLLCVTRQEIIDYLKNRNLNWRHDYTNDQCVYRRNFLRHKLIPQLQENCQTSVAEQLFDLSEGVRRFYGLTCKRAEKLWPGLADCAEGRIALDLKMLAPEHPAVKVELVQRCLALLGCGEQNLTQEHYEKILQLTKEKTSGRQIELPDGFIVRYEYGKLVFTDCHCERSNLISKTAVNSIEFAVPGQTRFGDYLVEAGIFDAEMGAGKFKAGKTGFVEWFDWEKIKPPLIVRTRKDGDRFIPLGLVEEKKVGRFLIDQRVPQRIRKKVLVVADSEKIIWLWPIRMCQQAKITEKTKKILRLQITDAGSDREF